MSRLNRGLLVVFSFVTLSSVCSAASMTATLDYLSGVPGGPGNVYPQGSFALPDLSAGGTVSLGSDPLPDTWNQWTLSSLGTPSTLPIYTQDINSTFGITIGLNFPDSPTSIRLSGYGRVTGRIREDTFGPRYSGDLSAVVTNLDLRSLEPLGAIDLPSPVLDLLQHPERIHLRSYALGVGPNTFVTTLTIDPPVGAPPTAVPEPSTWSIFAVLLLGLVAFRRFSHSTEARRVSLPF